MSQSIYEGRKRTILITASILVARKCEQLEGRPSPALYSAIADAVSLADRIMQRIDNHKLPNAKSVHVFVGCVSVEKSNVVFVQFFVNRELWKNAAIPSHSVDTTE